MRLSELEKKAFDLICRCEVGELEKAFSTEGLYDVCDLLRYKGLINFTASEQHEVMSITPTSKGNMYYKENPTLSDGIEEEIKRLQKQNLELQNSDLEYKKKIRRQETIIRNYKLLSAIIGIIGLLGWLFLLIFNWIQLINFFK